MTWADKFPFPYIYFKNTWKKISRVEITELKPSTENTIVLLFSLSMM